MNRDLERDLQTRFPWFFRDLYGDPRQTCMARGCDFADGWYRIVERLCEELEPVASPEFKFFQIKEKWGQMRIYARHGTEETNRLIKRAEKESLGCCELCGVTEEVTIEGRGPTRALCPSCREEILINKDDVK